MPIDTSLDFVPINIAVITISDSRTKENDTSGDTLEKRITDAGHIIVKRTIIPDNISQIKDTLETMSKEKEIDCIITTGGTGLTGRDTTPEAVNAIASKHIDGFGELFRQVSFEKIGTSAIQSRAVAALINSTYVFLNQLSVFLILNHHNYKNNIHNSPQGLPTDLYQLHLNQLQVHQLIFL